MFERTSERILIPRSRAPASRIATSGLPQEVTILGADQKERGLLGTKMFLSEGVSEETYCAAFRASLALIAGSCSSLVPRGRTPLVSTKNRDSWC